MTEFVIHGIPGSPYVQAPLMLLEEKGASWRLEPLPFGPRPAEYLRRQPFGKIPAFVHGDFEMHETQAFLRYVDRVVPEPALTPSDPRRAARMDQLINITDDYVRSRINGPVSFALHLAPLLGMPADREGGLAALPAAAQVLEVIDGLLGAQVFLTGDTLTLADVMLAPHLAFLRDFAEGRDLLAARPALDAWLARMEARPSMAATTWPRLLELTGVELPQPVAA